jgi:hypothetical protein
VLGDGNPVCRNDRGEVAGAALAHDFNEIAGAHRRQRLLQAASKDEYPFRLVLHEEDGPRRIVRRDPRSHPDGMARRRFVCGQCLHGGRGRQQRTAAWSGAALADHLDVCRRSHHDSCRELHVSGRLERHEHAVHPDFGANQRARVEAL